MSMEDGSVYIAGKLSRKKVVSGGQTGVDCAALDTAMARKAGTKKAKKGQFTY